MQNNCISTKNFEDTCTIYSASKPVEFLWVKVFLKISTSNKNIN